jgi:hypothetical protein
MIPQRDMVRIYHYKKKILYNVYYSTVDNEFSIPVIQTAKCIEEMLNDNIYLDEIIFDDSDVYNESYLINFFQKRFKIEHTIEPDQEINKLEHNHTEPNDNDDNEPIPQINEDSNQVNPSNDYYEMLNPEIRIIDEPDDISLAINREHLNYDFNDDDEELNPDPVDEEQISGIVSSINF